MNWCLCYLVILSSAMVSAPWSSVEQLTSSLSTKGCIAEPRSKVNNFLASQQDTPASAKEGLAPLCCWGNLPVQWDGHTNLVDSLHDHTTSALANQDPLEPQLYQETTKPREDHDTSTCCHDWNTTIPVRLWGCETNYPQQSIDIPTHLECLGFVRLQLGFPNDLPMMFNWQGVSSIKSNPGDLKHSMFNNYASKEDSLASNLGHAMLHWPQNQRTVTQH